MKTLCGLLIMASAFFFSGTLHTQAQTTASTVKTKTSSLENLAEKRAIRLKQELFLSNDQFDQIKAINLEMLKKLAYINSQNLSRADRNKQVAQLESSTKNQIIPLLTPYQRERFESSLFASVYQTKIDKKHALTSSSRH